MIGPRHFGTRTRRLFCAVVILGVARAACGLTLVVDFIDPGQDDSYDQWGDRVETFDVTAYGFMVDQFDAVTWSVMNQLKRDYYYIPTTGADSRSPIPDGMELDIDFVMADVGQLPANGDPDYYYMQVGDYVNGLYDGLGVAGLGTALNGSPGTVLGSVYTNHINELTLPSPYTDILQSGDMAATSHAINGTLAHEIGHAVSLLHLDKSGSVTPEGKPPIMATGAIDLPNVDRIFDREFAWSGTNSQEGGAEQFHVQELVDALGLRAAPATGDVNLDDSVDDADAYTLDDVLGGVSPVPYRPDVDRDGAVQSADMVALVRDTLGYPSGDANLDGDVDVFQLDGNGDAQLLGVNLGTTSGADWLDADFNGDGDVDVFQLDGNGDAQILGVNLGAGMPDLGDDAPAGTAEVVYNYLSGELFFDVGAGGNVTVIGIEVTGGYDTANADDFFTVAAGQNDGVTLAFYDFSGLPDGEDLVATLPAGLTAGDLGFAYTLSGDNAGTYGAPVTIVPEPATMLLLGLGGAAALIRRKK